MEIYLILGMAVLIYSFVTLLLNSECWKQADDKCRCEECMNLCQSTQTIAPSVMSVSSRIDVFEQP